MTHLQRGRYLALVTKALAERIAERPAGTHAVTTDLHAAEVADRLALHLARVVEIGISTISERDRVDQGLALAAGLVDAIARCTWPALGAEAPAIPGAVLTAVLGTLPDGQPAEVDEPLMPLLDTSLLTNAPGEPRIGQQIATEIPSADRIDLIMAFIRHSGIAPLLPMLRRHCEAGRPVRVLTTVYTGSTEARALAALRDLGADVRVSYDESTTRLHAKSWLFHRASGYSTAYVGSSNLTHSAQVTGLEWNVRFAAPRNPHVIDKIAAVFESYWQSGDFVAFDAAQFEGVNRRNREPDHHLLLSPIEITLKPFQERLLEQIALARLQGEHRNLLVSATGTGKTVMAAVDYARLRRDLPRSRLLFVAHRKEILQQSQATFRHVLRDAAFGELWVEGRRPVHFDHVFASIQSLPTASFHNLPPDHYDVVIVDEFHHADAQSYSRLLQHLRPRQLLGLTATPERGDGGRVQDWFHGRIAAELRLWDAIDQQWLVPFTYFGIADTVDYRQLPWQRGRGYAPTALTQLLTADDVWVRRIIQSLVDKLGDLSTIRALGFCVSVEHARFMARHFAAAGIAAAVVTGDTEAAAREAALRGLAAGSLKVVFSVDVFNEGVDIPQVDTLLLLRPTDSPTLFLQQLGRGLRKWDGKTHCTVFDLVGQHHREFRFDRRLQALLGGTRKDVIAQVESGFPFLPAGCHMEFDRVARAQVLESIRRSVPNRWDLKVQELRALATDRHRLPSLHDYLEATDLNLEDVYAGDRCWTDLLDAAGLATAPRGPHETQLRRAIGRMLHVDDLMRLDGYLAALAGSANAAGDVRGIGTPTAHSRLQRMLLSSLFASVGEVGHLPPAQSADLLHDHPAVVTELTQLLTLLRRGLTHVGHVLQDRQSLPLTVHARYSRPEIQAAFDDGDCERTQVPPWREGVKWMSGERCDVFLITFDKTGKRFSPTTRYRDYAINRTLLHWESQSGTRSESETGRRYRHHVAQHSGVMVFARLRDDDRSFHFLGPVHYVSHQGDMPMQVTWRLAQAIPGDLFADFAAAVA